MSPVGGGGNTGGSTGSPPTSNGVIGQIAKGGQWSVADVGYYMWSVFTTTTAGTIGYGHLYTYTRADDTTYVLSLHNATTGAMLCSGSLLVTDSSEVWINVQMGSTYNIIAATNYILCFQCSVGPFRTGMDTALGGSIMYYAQSPIANPAGTITLPGSSSDASNKLSIIFNNVSGAPE